MVTSKLGWADSTSFLEQFRYIIVASQLLGERPNLGAYQHSVSLATANNSTSEALTVQLSPFGIFLTGLTAFVLAWVAHWVRTLNIEEIDTRSVLLYIAILITFTTGSYFFAQRQWMKYVRNQAIHNASTLVTSAQNFNTTASSAIALIQEVELVSRGYRTYVYICKYLEQS